MAISGASQGHNRDQYLDAEVAGGNPHVYMAATESAAPGRPPARRTAAPAPGTAAGLSGRPARACDTARSPMPPAGSPPMPRRPRPAAGAGSVPGRGRPGWCTPRSRSKPGTASPPAVPPARSRASAPGPGRSPGQQRRRWTGPGAANSSSRAQRDPARRTGHPRQSPPSTVTSGPVPRGLGIMRPSRRPGCRWPHRASHAGIAEGSRRSPSGCGPPGDPNDANYSLRSLDLAIIRRRRLDSGGPGWPAAWRPAAHQAHPRSRPQGFRQPWRAGRPDPGELARRGHRGSLLVTAQLQPPGLAPDLGDEQVISRTAAA